MKSQINVFLTNLQQTHADRTATAIRILLGVLFVMTGVMKFVFPALRAAFSGQILTAALPFHDLNMWLVPAVEIAIGALLLVGLFTRLATVVVFGLMAVATYVHLVVHDPALFPLQPTQPIIPGVVMLLGLYLLWRGGGAGSLDRRSQAAGAAPMRQTAAGRA